LRGTGFRRKRQQILDAAAAAGQHDHGHVRMPVELGEGLEDLRHRRRSLHRGIADLETYCGPALLGHAEHIALGGAGAAGDQPDRPGQEGNRALEARIEQSLRGQQGLEPFDAGQQFADADWPNLGNPQRQCAAPGEIRQLAVDDDPAALLQRHRRTAQQRGVAGHRE
jgi:hypothetical protein